MNLIPWRNKREHRDSEEPLSSLPTRLRDEVDQLFDRFFQESFLGGRFGSLNRWGVGLRTDLAESDTEVTVTAELPGVDPKDVEINVTGNMLTIRGEKKHEKQEKNRNYHYMERGFGSFHRSVQLPSSVDAQKVDATFKNGVLTVTVAKRPDATPKRVPVKTG